MGWIEKSSHKLLTHTASGNVGEAQRKSFMLMWKHIEFVCLGERVSGSLGCEVAFIDRTRFGSSMSPMLVLSWQYLKCMCVYIYICM